MIKKDIIWGKINRGVVKHKLETKDKDRKIKNDDVSTWNKLIQNKIYQMNYYFYF